MKDLPVALGGTPVRNPGSSVHTPIITNLDRQHVDEYLRAADFQPGSETLSAPPVVERAGTWQRGSLAAEHQALSDEFTHTHGAGTDDFYSVPVSNGTRAISMALTAVAAHAERLGLRRPVAGDNVIVPALTWSGTATAVLDRGLVPRISDVDADTLCMDPASVRELVDERTFAIVAVHLYNRISDLDGLAAIAGKYGIALVEDCAHAHGARYRGRPVGTVGVIGTFSLQASKTLTCGEGGIVTTRDRRLAEQICSLANCGRPCGEAIEIPGCNDRLPGLSASFARAQLKQFEARHTTRSEVWRRLDDVAAALPGVEPLPSQPDTVSPTYKWAARYPSEHWGGMTLDQLADVLSAELDVEVGRVYEPLTRSRLYQPLNDPFVANWAGRDEVRPARYPCPTAAKLYESVLVVEHAAALSADFTEGYREAVRKSQKHKRSLATRLQTVRR
jgi:dTDP-4-amino-4,6-dideoxygalactose transaminase